MLLYWEKVEEEQEESHSISAPLPLFWELHWVCMLVFENKAEM